MDSDAPPRYVVPSANPHPLTSGVFRAGDRVKDEWASESASNFTKPDRALVASLNAGNAFMANALAPGGVLGILCPGEGHDRPTVDMFEATGDPLLARLSASIVNNQVPVPDLTQWITDAGLALLDVWSETRYRVVAPQAIADRIEAVATHLWSDLPEDEQADVIQRIRATFAAAADSDGMYRYRFVKTFAVAERPGG